MATYFADMTQVVFMIAFIMAVYNNILIIKSQIYAQEGTDAWIRILSTG